MEATNNYVCLLLLVTVGVDINLIMNLDSTYLAIFMNNHYDFYLQNWGRLIPGTLSPTISTRTTTS